MRRAIGVRALFAGVLTLTLTLCAAAQDSGIPTLHVYTNLLQIPTLVLSEQHKPLRPIPENRFFVSIDDGKPFRVTHARLEGNDPIALSILVDSDHLAGASRGRLEDAIAGLVPASIHPNDQVSLYRLNCRLSRAVAEQPTSMESLQVVAALLFGSMDRRDKSRGEGNCPKRWNLFDAIESAVDSFEPAVGRRVLLVMTDGVDRGSRSTWQDVRSLAQVKGVAIFAIEPQPETVIPIRGPRGMLGQETVTAVTEMPALCESTGGMLLDTKQESVAEQLQHLLVLVRNRYIIEFPRPNADAGAHNMTITVPKLPAFIRPAGISVELPDPDLAKDPNTFLPDPASAPEVGNKRPK